MLLFKCHWHTSNFMWIGSDLPFTHISTTTMSSAVLKKEKNKWKKYFILWHFHLLYLFLFLMRSSSRHFLPAITYRGHQRRGNYDTQLCAGGLNSRAFFGETCSLPNSAEHRFPLAFRVCNQELDSASPPPPPINPVLLLASHDLLPWLVLPSNSLQLGSTATSLLQRKKGGQCT